MFETLAECPVCSGTSLSNYLICQDHSVSQEKFAIARCNSCSFLFTNPRPTSERLPGYYQSQDYISHQNKATNPVNLLYKFVRYFTLRSKVRLPARYQPVGELLDVGCGTGHFLKEAQRSGWSVTGVEPDPRARQLAETNIQNKVHPHPDDIKGEKYNIITLWHVLEHVSDLNAYLISLRNLLAKKGTIIVAVPNHNSLDATHYKEHWAAYDVPRHLYHFDQSTMQKLLAKHKFKIVDTLPMKLDAFYVSLLSEKYLGNGVKGYINSIINGLKSNSYAKKNNSEYSSLIFVIQRK